VVLCPDFVIGPFLNSSTSSKNKIESLNATNKMLLNFINGHYKKIVTGGLGMVDVRDVAKAHVLAIETKFPPNEDNRYFLTAQNWSWQQIVEFVRTDKKTVELLGEKVKNITDKNEVTDDPKPQGIMAAVGCVPKTDNSKIKKDFKIEFRSMESMLRDMVQFFVTENYL